MTEIEADAKLHRLLGGEPVAWLVRRARDRLEAGRPLTGTVTLHRKSSPFRGVAVGVADRG